MNIRIEEIICATGGKLLFGNKNQTVRNIMLDSRTSQGDDLFIPIKGEKTDGHKYIEAAFSQGAVASLTSICDEEFISRLNLQEGQNLIEVTDTVVALQSLGRYLREGFSVPFIGITGSVGKTSTREMITTALSSAKKVTSTKGNSNGQLGVPVTLSLMDKDAEVAVTEMGMSLPGEMSKIAAIAKPDLCVMTNIGVSHIQQLGSQMNILQEKLHIIDGFGPENILLVNGDDPYLKLVAKASKGDKTALPFKLMPCKVLTYGFGEENDFKRADYNFKLQVQGLHNEMNAMAAIATCEVMGVPVGGAIKALECFSGFGRRLEFKKMKGFTVIDDSYNASPDSMKAALQVLGSVTCEGRRIAVLADMLELGPDSPMFHQEVGEYAAIIKPDAVFTVGELISRAEGPIVAEGIPVFHYPSNEDLFKALEKFIKKNDLILTKGSNGMHLNEIVKSLEGVDLE